MYTHTIYIDTVFNKVLLCTYLLLHPIQIYPFGLEIPPFCTAIYYNFNSKAKIAKCKIALNSLSPSACLCYLGRLSPSLIFLWHDWHFNKNLPATKKFYLKITFKTQNQTIC